MTNLTITEHNSLLNLENIIQKGLSSFYEVGAALITIRNSRLYRETHGTFEEYCQDRWNIKRRQAYRLIDAAEVVENVSLGTQTPPATERQARPLAPLIPEQQREAWTEATQKAESESRPVTAHDVEDAVCKLNPHVSFNSGENEWYTPREYIEAARRVMGSIDLDPASSEIANKTVKATTFYSKKDDGLEKIWRGNVYLNPPYSSELIKKFVSKFASHVLAGDIKTGIILVNNATETAWFRELVECSVAIVFTTGRIRFLDVQGHPGAPLQGQAVIYSGESVNKFLAEFQQFGWGARL